MKYLFSILVIIIFNAQLNAQEVVPVAEPLASDFKQVIDSAGIPKPYFEYSPKRAGMYAAMLPGAGQLYNKQYWKLPIVYGAMGVGVGYIVHNLNRYNIARVEIANRATLGSSRNERYIRFTDQQLQGEQDYYRQNLDVSALLTGLAYLLQIVDAIVSNHLKGFDITPDISMKFNPLIVRPQQVGVGIAFNIH